jgi:hypothetical protein
MTLTLPILLPFVSVESETIKEPIHLEAWSLFVDSSLVIRTPRIPETSLTENPRITLNSEFLQPLADLPHEGWLLLPEDGPELEQCPECDGKRIVATCPECKGEGDIRLVHEYKDLDGEACENSYTCECRDCKGSGQVRHKSGTPCIRCRGLGKACPRTPVQIGDAWFRWDLIQKLKQLPNPQIFPVNSEDRRGSLLRGEGWDGIILTCHAPL